MASDSRRFGQTAWKLALGLRLTVGLMACGAWGLVAAADTDAPQQAATTAPAASATPAATPATTAPSKSSSGSKSGSDRRIHLNFKGASWTKVLKRVAKHADLTLVMKKSPPGTYTRNDLNQYSIAEAIWVLNHELEPAGYRLVHQNSFLMLLDLDELRSDYRPALTRRQFTEDPPKTQQVSGTAQPGAAAEPALLETVAPETAHETDPKKAKPADKDDDAAEDKRTFRITYFSTPWSRVLPQVADKAGLTLVMKRCPSGAFQHPDFKKYTVTEVIQILNHELDDTNFRLIRQGKFLIVLYTEDLRAEYERPVLRPRRGAAADRANPEVRQVSGATTDGQSPDPTVKGQIVNPSFETRQPESQASLRREELPTSGPLLLETPAAARPLPLTASETRKINEPAEPPAVPESPASRVYVPEHATATVIARWLYSTLKGRSELLNVGLQGLPSFRVYSASHNERKESPTHTAAGKNTTVAFTMGIDTTQNRLLIEAPPRRMTAVLRLCQRLDVLGERSTSAIQLVSADAETCAVAQNFGPELNRLIAQRDPEVGRASGTSHETEIAQVPAATEGNEPKLPTQPVAPSSPKGISDIIKGLKGDVSVESVPDLGILILRGGQSDVDAVMKVIKEIERLSVGSTPKINFLLLQFVNSESFAKLLNEVYKALSGLRTGESKQLISVFPIVKPNAVLVLAPPADMQSVLNLAKELDQPVNPEFEFQVFRLRHGYAAQVAKSVSDFYKSPRGLGTTVNAFADARTNSIVVQARPRDLAEIGKLIEQLDGPTASQATIKVFALQNGDATAIQRLLETLFGTQGQRPGATPGAGPEEGGSETAAPTALRISVDVRTNTIIALGPPDTLRAVDAVITRLDNSDVHQRQTMVIRLKNNASDNVARAITEFVRSQRELQQIDPELMSSIELLEREVFVVSEPVSNSLLLSATPRYFDDLKKMIDKLDAPPAQVIIQALIVEVELDNTDEFGIELGFQSPVLFQRSQLTNQQTFQTTQTVNPTTSVANNVLLSEQANPGFQFGDPSTGLGLNPAATAAQVGSQELSNFGMGRIDNTLGFGGLVLSASSESVSALLRALSYKQTIHVLSRPQIRTLDNRMATIQVGQRVPVVYAASTNSTTGAITPIIQYDSAGIILTVQPRITPDGMIALEAYAEKSQYEPGGVTLLSDVVSGRSIQSPVKDISRAEASVNVASGNTVVMGGMISSSDTVITRKVPWLADVPIIGQAFRYDSKATVRKELLIFLTPRVIRDDADDEMIKQIETERVHFLVEEAESIHGPILSNKPPALEECPPDGYPVTPLLPVPQPSMPVRPSVPGPIIPPAAAPAPISPPAPPSAMPPTSSRTFFDLSRPKTANAPADPNTPPALPIPAQPATKPVSGTTTDGKSVSQSWPAENAGAVRSVSFEEPAAETDSRGTR